MTQRKNTQSRKKGAKRKTSASKSRRTAYSKPYNATKGRKGYQSTPRRKSTRSAQSKKTEKDYAYNRSRGRYAAVREKESRPRFQDREYEDDYDYRPRPRQYKEPKREPTKESDWKWAYGKTKEYSKKAYGVGKDVSKKAYAKGKDASKKIYSDAKSRWSRQMERRKEKKRLKEDKMTQQQDQSSVPSYLEDHPESFSDSVPEPRNEMTYAEMERTRERVMARGRKEEPMQEPKKKHRWF